MDFTHGGNVYKVAREKNIAIEDIVDFSANINPFGLSTKGEEAIKAAWSGLLNYPDPDYVALRKSLSQFHGCRPNEIFLGNGAIDMIFFLMRGLHSKKAMILAPTFVEYERALNAINAQVDYYYLKEENGFKLVLEDYLNHIKDHDCIVLCNPNNPTGQLIPKEDICKILEFAKARNISVVIDEAFMDFSDDEEGQTAVEFLKTYSDLYILRSITKFFAVPGLRIGYLMTCNEDFASFYKDHKEPWSINYFAETYTIHALADVNYIEKTKAYMIQERIDFCSKLNKLDYIHAYPSQGNYVFFKYKGQEQLKEVLETQGVLIRSCSNYRGLDHTYFRVAVKKQELNTLLIEAIERIHDDKNI